MPKIKVLCEVCGQEVYRYPSGIKEHVFCSRLCAKEYTSKRMTEMNIKLNPTRMTDEVKENIRWGHMLKGEGKAYPKIHGRHAHRVMAEKILGRKLKPGEIVHHKDENKLNYSEENLEILKSQKEHAKLHLKDGRFK
jgi:hypothetical protein